MGDDENEGCFNKAADSVPSVDRTWSDTNLGSTVLMDLPIKRLKCRNCGETDYFRVFKHQDYEASARCRCGMWYIVHAG